MTRAGAVQAPMFKRNQVEGAIINVWGPEPPEHKLLLRNQIKRLLDTDRSLGRNKRSSDPERSNFAFYSTPMQGKGYDNWFSDYEAFALLTGLRLMQQGWPQGFAVSLLRQVRRQLEKAYFRIANDDPTLRSNDQRIMQLKRPGTLAVDDSDPLFLGIISPRSERKSSPNAVIGRSRELLAFLMAQGSGFTITAMEIESSLHSLMASLTKIKLRSRGRSKRKKN
jgi:hypothetical protein